MEFLSLKKKFDEFFHIDEKKKEGAAYIRSAIQKLDAKEHSMGLSEEFIEVIKQQEPFYLYTYVSINQTNGDAPIIMMGFNLAETEDDEGMFDYELIYDAYGNFIDEKIIKKY